MTSAEVGTHPLVLAAQQLADSVLAPAAADAESSGVPRSHLAALAQAGLLGIHGPSSAGGADVPAAVSREISEILVGGCGSTWFVQVQHHGPVLALAASDSPAADRFLAPLCAGESLAGTAFAHLRSKDRPVRMQRVPGGWRVDGTAGWFTGWGLLDVFTLGGRTDDDEIVFLLVDAAPAPGLVASDRIGVAAFAGAPTVRLDFDGLVVPDDALVSLKPYAEWSAMDRLGPVNVNPAVFGIAQAAVRLLEGAGQDAAAAGFDAAVGRVRREAYALLDEAAPEERLDDRLALRVEAGDLALRVTAAAVAAGGGRGMTLTSPAQRLAREALFMSVQAQNAEVRAAQLAYATPR